MRPQGPRPEEAPLISDDHFTEPSAEEYAIFIAGVGGSNGSSQKHVSWHPYIGLMLYLAFLGGYAVVLVASWLSLLPSILRSQEICILAGLNMVLLPLTTGLQEYLSLYHKQQLQCGYLRFCQQLSGLLPLPFMVMSYGNCSVLAVVLWPSEKPPLLALHIILATEVALVGAVVLSCTWLVTIRRIWHNRPDAYEELTSAMSSAEAGAGCGYGEQEDLVERQAALIRFQQANLQQLSHEILRLQERLSNHSYCDGEEAGRQVEAAQLLAVREQEQQALAAEREQLQAELLRTHGMLGEQQDEMARLRDINQQYMDENTRLRLMLDEWSARSAKLEIALDNQLRTVDELRHRLTAGDENRSL